MKGTNCSGSGLPANPKPPKASRPASKVITRPSALGSSPSRRCSGEMRLQTSQNSETAVPSTPTLAQVPPSTATSGKTAR